MGKRVDPTSKSTPMTDVLADVAKKYDLSVGALSSVAEPIRALTTGNVAIDYLTGVGGLPLGRVTELYGQPSSGKSTTALQAAAALQREIIEQQRDEYILYLDYEHALDPDYAASLGLDVEHPSFQSAQPYWLEQGAEAAIRLIRTGKIRLSIWDSVAEMTPKSTLDADFDRRTGAMERARQIKELLARLTPLIHENNCAAVFLNHSMESLDMTGMARPGIGPQETTPGGKALKFYASLRMSYRQIGNIKRASVDALTNAEILQVVGTDVKVKVTKNKIGDPFREAVVRVRFGQGFDNAWSALEILLAYKKVVKSGAWYYFDRHGDLLAHDDMPRSATGRPTLQGESTVLQFAETHPQWRNRLIALAAAEVEAAPTLLAPASAGDGLVDGLGESPDAADLLGSLI